MLAEHLLKVPTEHCDSLALIAGDKSLCYADISSLTRDAIDRWRALAGLRVGLILSDPADYIPAVAALDALRCHAFLAGRREPQDVNRLAQSLRWDAIVRNFAQPPELLESATGKPSDLARRRLSTVTLLTSGTTGTPKAANHTWSSLAAPVRRAPRYLRARWLCAYPLNLYAGTQVMLQALLNWSTLVTLNSLEPELVARTMRNAAVTHAGGTPTFWRRLLMFAPREELRACRLEQITMGGEAATQALLDQLSEVFPETRLIHIYASTELGRLFSVADRREGFPANFLQQSPEVGIELRIEDGELLAHSAGNAMVGYESSVQETVKQPGSSAHGRWVATGDLVEVQGDRVFFRGRKSDVINVGGRKVVPILVEEVLRSAAAVGDVRVYGRKSSLVGQLVAADVVLTEGINEDDARVEINRLARSRLADHEIPRVLRFVNQLAYSGAMKISRSEEQ